MKAVLCVAVPGSFKYSYPPFPGFCGLDQGSSCLKWPLLCSLTARVLLIFQANPNITFPWNLPQFHPGQLVTPSSGFRNSLFIPLEILSSRVYSVTSWEWGKHCALSAEHRLSISRQISLPPQEWDHLLLRLRENPLKTLLRVSETFGHVKGPQLPLEGR